MNEAREFTIAEIYLTPPEEEQTMRILQGLCPHNKGWTYVGHSHNSDAYMCNSCTDTGWY